MDPTITEAKIKEFQILPYYAPGATPPPRWTPTISGVFHWHKWNRTTFGGILGPYGYDIELIGEGKAIVETPWECSECFRCWVIREIREQGDVLK